MQIMWVVATVALLATLQVAAATNPAAPYLAVAQGKCGEPGSCGIVKKPSVYKTTDEQRKVLAQISRILTPRGIVDNLNFIGEVWSMGSLEKAMQDINTILDDLPPHFFRGASPLVHGPEMRLGQFYRDMKLPRLRPPKKHLMPVMHHLYRLYRASAKMISVRDTAVRLLRDFSLTAHVEHTEYPITQYGIEPLYVRLMLDSTEDLVFLRHIFEHGNVSLNAYYPRPSPGEYEDPYGLSVLNIVHHANSEIYITKTLFVVSDAMKKGNFSTCQEAMMKIESVERDNLRAGRRSPVAIGDFRGLFNDDYGTESETWKKLQDDWNTHGARQHIMKIDTKRLTEDVSITILKSLLGISAVSSPDRHHTLDVNEIFVRWPYDARNTWHQIGIYQYDRFFQVLADFVKKQIVMEESENPETESLLRLRLQRSMLQRERFSHRTPLMSAAALCNSADDAIVKNFLELAQWSGVDMDFLLNSISDDYGNTAQMYLDKTAKYDQLDRTSELWTSAGYSKNIQRVWLGPTILDEDWHADWEEDGGWGQFSKRPDLDLPASHQLSDIHIVQGLPTIEELARLVNLQEPVIFRNAMKDLKVPRSIWSLDNILEKYGDVEIHVGKIPYLSTFAAQMPGYESEGTEEYVTTMREYINNFRHDNDGEVYSADEVPVYLFTSDFANENPQIYDESIQALEWVRNLTGIQYVTEGQFFVGEAATGAPVHWHNSAFNFLSYGRKRWVLFSPEEAFYSVKSSLHFFNEDLPDIYDKSHAIFNATDRNLHPIEFVQEAGDIVLVPDYWGHGTLNLEATAGIAFEFHSLANKLFQTTADGYVAMNLGLQGNYEPLENFFKRWNIDPDLSQTR